MAQQLVTGRVLTNEPEDLDLDFSTDEYHVHPYLNNVVVALLIILAANVVIIQLPKPIIAIFKKMSDACPWNHVHRNPYRPGYDFSVYHVCHRDPTVF